MFRLGELSRLAVGDLECAGLDGALDFFLFPWEGIEVRI